MHCVFLLRAQIALSHVLMVFCNAIISLAVKTSELCHVFFCVKLIMRNSDHTRADGRNLRVFQHTCFSLLNAM